MSAIRTFVAIEASDDVRDRALNLIERLRPAADSVRWVAAANLHWTLQFLGQVDETAVHEICRSVAEAVRQTSPFSLAARGVGAFPSDERPRTLWLGADQGADSLIALQGNIETALATQGFRGESRRYQPHLTLGRVGRGTATGADLSETLARNADFQAGTMDVREVVVFGSELTRDGPIYHAMGRAALGTA